MTDQNTTVRYEAVDGVATITLDRPETLNAMNDALMTDLHDALLSIVADDEIRVAVLTVSASAGLVLLGRTLLG